MHESNFFRKFRQFCKFLVLENFCIRPIVFAVKALQNLHAIQRTKSWRVSKIKHYANFEALLQQKLLVVWKNFPGPKICKIVWTLKKNYSHTKKKSFLSILESKTCIWKMKKKMKILQKFEIIFPSSGFCKRLKKLFSEKLKSKSRSFHTHFQVSKNIKNSPF